MHKLLVKVQLVLHVRTWTLYVVKIPEFFYIVFVHHIRYSFYSIADFCSHTSKVQCIDLCMLQFLVHPKKDSGFPVYTCIGLRVLQNNVFQDLSGLRNNQKNTFSLWYHNCNLERSLTKCRMLRSSFFVAIKIKCETITEWK